MVEIVFLKKEDARKFHTLLLHQLRSILKEQNQLQFIEDRHIGKVKIDLSEKKVLEASIKAFYEFMMKIKLMDIFRFILEEKYFFKEREEQQQILDIIHSILEGERKDLESFVKDYSIHELLSETIHQMFKENVSFTFDSFVKFRMRPLIDRLTKYVEISIDEYKMEQEYQIFVEKLRGFLEGREPLISTLHLLMKEEIVFFNETFQEIKRHELVKMVDRKLLSDHPIYVDSVTIAPLLSIAPKTVYLYTDSEDEPLVRTIRNIFEERVNIRPIQSFHQSFQLKQGGQQKRR